MRGNGASASKRVTTASSLSRPLIAKLFVLQSMKQGDGIQERSAPVRRARGPSRARVAIDAPATPPMTPQEDRKKPEQWRAIGAGGRGGWQHSCGENPRLRCEFPNATFSTGVFYRLVMPAENAPSRLIQPSGSPK